MAYRPVHRRIALEHISSTVVVNMHMTILLADFKVASNGFLVKYIC